LEELSGGFSNRFLLPGFVKAVRVQFLFIGDVDFFNRYELVEIP